VVDRYFPVVSWLEDELEKIEEKIFTQNDPQKNIELLYSVKQRVILLKHTSSAMLEAVGKLHGGRVPAICLEVQDYFRDVLDHVHRINDSVERIRETLITAIHVNLTMISISDSKVSKRLAGWAAILAIPTMVAGIYGMNFKYMPELEWQWGYPVTLGFIVLLDSYLLFRFRRAGWI
jgi:magnesium transporter